MARFLALSNLSRRYSGMASFEWSGAGSLSWPPLSGDPERGDLRGGRMGGRDIWPTPPTPGCAREGGEGEGGGVGVGGRKEEEKEDGVGRERKVPR